MHLPREILCVGVFLVLGYSDVTNNCSGLMIRWQKRECGPFRTCLITHDQMLDISPQGTLKLECNHSFPDIELLQCIITIMNVYRLKLRNCKFYKLNIQDYLLSSMLKIMATKKDGRKEILDSLLYNIPFSNEARTTNSNPNGGFNINSESINQLESLILEYRDLVQFPKSQCLHVPNLEILWLNHGKLMSLRKHAFQHLLPLTTLKLAWNRISNIHLETFASLNNLVILDLTGNLITTLTSYHLKNLQSLSVLCLGNNKLIEVPTNFYVICPKLQLHVKGNVTTKRIKWKLLINADNLQSLNDLNCLRNSPKASLFKCQILWTSNSSNLKSKTKLSLSLNSKKQPCSRHITLLSGFISSQSSKEIAIQSVFSAFKELEKSLSKIGQKYSSTFDVLVNLRKNDLSNNLPDRNSLRSSERLPRIKMPSFEVAKIKNILNCPLHCQCTELQNKFNIKVNCSNRNLFDVPRTIPEGSTKLHLENNNISKMPLLQSRSWDKVTHLYLSHNHIESFDNWIAPEVLKTLAIDHNKLKNLSKHFMLQIDESPEFRIYLAGNLWPCDCKSGWLIRYMKRISYKIMDYSNLMCIEENSTNALLQKINVSNKEFCPQDEEITEIIPFPSTTGGITVSAITIIIIVTVIMMGIIFYLYDHRKSLVRNIIPSNSANSNEPNISS